MTLHEPSLPPGVTPDQAGRSWAWKWLQGQANHLRREKRRRFLARIYPEHLVGRWLSICCPYRTNYHPGAEELLQLVLGVSESTARKAVGKTYPLSPVNAEKLANYLRRQYGGVERLIVELEAYARNPPPDRRKTRHRKP